MFALETYCPAVDGLSAARIEEEVVVTDDGPSILTLFPAEDLVVTNPTDRSSRERYRHDTYKLPPIRHRSVHRREKPFRHPTEHVSRSSTRAPERSSPRSPTGVRRTRSRRSTPPHDALPAWAKTAPAGAREILRRGLRGDDRARRVPGRADLAGERQGAARRARRSRLRRRVLPLVPEEAVRNIDRLTDIAPSGAQPASSCCASRSACAPWSRRGTSRRRWRPARSGPPLAAGCTVVLKPAATPR